MSNSEPKTVEALLALDELPQFNYRTVIADTPELVEKYQVRLGDTVHIPVREPGVVTPISRRSIVFAWDEDDVAWRPVWDGERWYKQKSHLYF